MINKYLDLTEQFNLDGSAYFEVGSYNYAIVQSIDPSDDIELSSTIGNINDFSTDINAYNLSDGSSSSVIYNGIYRIDLSGRIIIFSGVGTVQKLLIMLVNTSMPVEFLSSSPAPPPVVNSTLSVDISVAPQLFDIPFGTSNFGCWVKVTDPAGFPRLFSVGQYPSASQAISIEGGTLYFWYDGVIQVSYSLTSYVGNWVWISVMGDGSGGITVWVNGVDVVSTIIPIPTAMTNTMYIGSENAPNTYLNGNMASVIFDIGRDLRFPPTSPLTTTGGTAFLVGQGFDLNSQTTNQGAVGVLTNTNCTYSTDSPYPPGNGGSIQFG